MTNENYLKEIRELAKSDPDVFTCEELIKLESLTVDDIKADTDWFWDLVDKHLLDSIDEDDPYS